MVYGKPATPITARKPVLKDGRWFPNQAAADRGPSPSPRRNSRTFQTTTRVEGCLRWLTAK